MTNEHIQAVIFDMDGLMLGTQRLATQAWRQAVASHGFDLTDEINLSMLGRNVHDAVAILRSAFGAQFPVDDVRELAARNFAQLTSTSGIPVKAGLWELLEFLDAEAIPKAVATPTARRECGRHLEDAHLLSRFRVIVRGDEVRCGKPAPDLFLKAAELLKARSARCVVLEDSFPGIRAASAGGMIPIMVPDLKEADDEMRRLAYAVVGDLHEAQAVIHGIMNKGTKL